MKSNVFSLRRLVTPLLFVLGGLYMTLALAAEEWTVGQVTSMSGSNGADLGQGLAQGQRIYFEHINATGGVHGKKLHLVTLDDQYIPDDTVKLTQTVLQKFKPIALMGYRGTANTLALVKSGILAQEGVPLIGTLTGAREVQDAPNIYHVRTSYATEISKLVTQIITQGQKSIAIVYVDDAFGQSGLAVAEEAVRLAGGKLAIKAGFDKAPDKIAASMQKAISAVAATQPNAVVMIAVGDPAYQFLGGYRDVAALTPLYSLSVVNPSEVIKKIGLVKAQGVGFSQVFPYPYNDTNSLAREYRALLRKYAPDAQPTYFGLEGFVNAKVFVAALRKAGPNATRASLMRALDLMGSIDLGEFDLRFSPAQHSGSHFTELTVISKSGRLLR